MLVLPILGSPVPILISVVLFARRGDEPLCFGVVRGAGYVALDADIKEDVSSSGAVCLVLGKQKPVAGGTSCWKMGPSIVLLH